MKEIYPNLFIGDERDYESQVKNQSGWYVIHACKEPYHRNALRYTGRGAPKDHPEYLIANRGNRLILNLVDAPDPKFIPKIIIDEALDFIEKGLKEKQKVLIHCNQGESRSPSIGLLYLAVKGIIDNESLQTAEREFIKRYPFYNSNRGIRGFLLSTWDEYMSEFKIG